MSTIKRFTVGDQVAFTERAKEQFPHMRKKEATYRVAKIRGSIIYIERVSRSGHIRLESWHENWLKLAQTPDAKTPETKEASANVTGT